MRTYMKHVAPYVAIQPQLDPRLYRRPARPYAPTPDMADPRISDSRFPDGAHSDQQQSETRYPAGGQSGLEQDADRGVVEIDFYI